MISLIDTPLQTIGAPNTPLWIVHSEYNPGKYFYCVPDVIDFFLIDIIFLIRLYTESFDDSVINIDASSMNVKPVNDFIINFAAHRLKG